MANLQVHLMQNHSSEAIVQVRSIFCSSWHRHLLFIHQDSTKLENIFVTWVLAIKGALTAADINFVLLHLNQEIFCTIKLWHGEHYPRATKWAMAISGGRDTMGVPFLYNSVQFPLVCETSKQKRKITYNLYTKVD